MALPERMFLGGRWLVLNLNLAGQTIRKYVKGMTPWSLLDLGDQVQQSKPATWHFGKQTNYTSINPKQQKRQHPKQHLLHQHPKLHTTALRSILQNLRPHRHQTKQHAKTARASTLPPILQVAPAPSQAPQTAPQTVASAPAPQLHALSISQITLPALLEVRTPISFRYLGSKQTNTHEANKGR